jgi:tryptophanyl-tRNA synthetase
VGDDQLQHLELVRTLARKFNARFGDTFTEPKPLMTTIPRLMSLSDPERKMSKTEPKGCVFLDDSPGDITEKVMAAVTDSGKEIIYDEKKKPAVANLIRLMSALTHHSIPDIERRFEGKGYRDFKATLAETIAEVLAPFRAEKQKLTTHQKTVASAFATGTEHARGIAEKKLAEVKERVGIILS